MRKWSWAILGLVATLVCVLWTAPGRVQSSDPLAHRDDTHTSRQEAPPTVAEPTPDTVSHPGGRTSPPTQARRRQRARADALRKRLRRTVANRDSSPGPASTITKPTRSPPAAATDRAKTPFAENAGTLTDKIGGRQDIAQSLNEDFMPLADECIADAQQRAPSLGGMLSLTMRVIGDPELGAVVESAEIGPGNEVDDAPLFECLQQTALSTMMPPPPLGGRDDIKITIALQPHNSRSSPTATGGPSQQQTPKFP